MGVAQAGTAGLNRAAAPARSKNPSDADAATSRGTALGRALLWFMVVFWIGRTIEQVVFLRINHALVRALTVLFVLGAVLFALPLLST